MMLSWWRLSWFQIWHDDGRAVRLGVVRFCERVVAPRFIAVDFLVAQPSAQDLLLCAKHLFVAAMVAWVHPGPAGNRQIRKGPSAFGALKFSGQQMQSAAIIYRWLTAV